MIIDEMIEDQFNSINMDIQYSSIAI